MKALVGAFNQEKALVGAFSVIVQLHQLIDLRHYLVVPQRDVAAVVLAREQTLLVELRPEPPVPHQIHVVAGVDGVLVLLLAELEGEQRVLAPGHVLLHLDLGLLLGQPGEPLPADTAQVDLGPGSEMNVPANTKYIKLNHYT